MMYSFAAERTNKQTAIRPASEQMHIIKLVWRTSGFIRIKDHGSGPRYIDRYSLENQSAVALIHATLAVCYDTGLINILTAGRN